MRSDLTAVVLSVVLTALMGLGLCGGGGALQRAGGAFNSRQHRSLLTVTNGGEFGDWTWPEKCPNGSYAVGFSVRVEALQYGGDDTALNGIRLVCGREGDRSHLYYVESHTGYFGEWSHPQYCPSGVLTSFQLRVEPPRGILGDDTSVNSVKFRCSSNPVLEAPGLGFGAWGHWSQDCAGGGICGIETKMEEYQYALDDSSLNDVRFHCCDRQ